METNGKTNERLILKIKAENLTMNFVICVNHDLDEREKRFFKESAMESTLELPDIFFLSDFFDLEEEEEEEALVAPSFPVDAA